MSALKAPLSIVVLAAAVAAGAVLVSSPAASEPAVRFPADQPVQLAGRVAMLEQRAHRLEQRLSAFEKVGLQSKPDGAYQLSVNGTSVSIERDGRVTVTPRASASGAPAIAGRLPPAAADCDPPYYFDADGIKRFIPSCL